MMNSEITEYSGRTGLQSSSTGSKYVIAAAGVVLLVSAISGFSVRLGVLALVVMFVAAVVAIFKRE
jgi:hypothetical protein